MRPRVSNLEMSFSLKAVFAAVAMAVCATACKRSNQAAVPGTQTPGAEQGSSPESQQTALAAQQPAPAGAVAVNPANPTIKAPRPGPPMVVRGVTVNVDLVEKALQNAPYRVHIILGDVRYSLGYEEFNTALADFQKISQDPAVTDQQKSAIAQVVEQVKQAASAQPR
jgi:hypothetical protein